MTSPPPPAGDANADADDAGAGAGAGVGAADAAALCMRSSTVAAMADSQWRCAASSGACSAYARPGVSSWKVCGCGYATVSSVIPTTAASGMSPCASLDSCFL